MRRILTVVRRVACGLAIAIPISSLAQTSTQQVPMTRARAQCELRELESVGYRPWEEDFYYPRNLELAQARLAAKKRAEGLEGVDTCGGGQASGASVGKTQ
ncbi:conserved exported hypothetical protein [Burkholderia sp. 8Y]|uniref:DUF4148 domain-containing protein n=1 Tax=Burkholderia sp. 8Y TaxID=2653133 RepID=UPI0012EFF9DE|nr:DUF4148 domain-containing protein [Burkholderia sp. 8Y]VXC70396.1 conserved exported hypothetical protein [Burkholderia sp. 8Y]